MVACVEKHSISVQRHALSDTDIIHFTKIVSEHVQGRVLIVFA